MAHIEIKIGRTIKQMRKSAGLSQIELAERVGVSFQQIQKYEKGASRISVFRLKQIAESLGINITLFFETGKTAQKVSVPTLEYGPAENHLENYPFLDPEEMTILKLFRKIKNKKLRESMVKQIKGVIELEKKAGDTSHKSRVRKS